MNEIKPLDPVRQAILLLIVFTGVFLTYSNHFKNSFHFDDSHTILNNPYIRDLKNIPLMFKDGSTFSSLPSNQTYRPVVTATLAIDYALGGKKLEPLWFHISTFVLYLVQGLLMFFLIRGIFNRGGIRKDFSLAAIFAVAWYLLHPANAETVNYIISRSDTLSTLCVVLAFVMYTGSTFCRKTFLYLIPVAIGTLAKPTTVVFGPLLFVYVLFFEEEAGVEDLFKKLWPVLKKTGIALVASAAMYKFYSHMETSTFTPGGTSTLRYIITQPYVTLRYFTTFFLPIDLSADTDWVTFSSLTQFKCMVGFAFVLLLLFAAIWLSREQRYRPISFGLIWFMLTLLPTSVVPLAEVMNDHRLFFPYIGLVISVTWTIVLILRRFKAELSSGLRIATWVGACLLLMASAWGTRERNKVWNTEESLWKDVTEKSPYNGRGQMNYGLNLMTRGDFEGAEKCFRRGLELWPYYSYLYINMGVLKDFTGKSEEAEKYLKQAIEYSNGSPEPNYYYARFLKMHKRYPEAIEQMNALFKISPGHLNGHYLMLEIYHETDDFVHLKEFAEQTLAIMPDDAEAKKYLEMSKNGTQRLDQLIKDAANQPTPEKYLQLSMTFYQAGKYQECISAAQEALKLKKDYAEAWNNVAAAYGALKNWDEEIKACEEALKIKPDYQLAKNNMDYARSMKKQP